MKKAIFLFICALCLQTPAYAASSLQLGTMPGVRGGWPLFLYHSNPTKNPDTKYQTDLFIPLESIFRRQGGRKAELKSAHPAGHKRLCKMRSSSCLTESK